MCSYREFGWQLRLTAILGLAVLLFVSHLTASLARNYSLLVQVKESVPPFEPFNLAGCRIPGQIGVIHPTLAHYGQGLQAWQQGDRSAAITEWKYTSDLAVTLLACAVVEYEKGQYDHANKLAELSTVLEPQLPRSHLVWGLSLLAQGNFSQSLVKCQQEATLANSRRRAEAYTCVGDTYWELLESTQALSAYMQALQVNPNLETANAGAGKAVYAVRRDAALALAYLEKARRLNPVSPWYPLLEGDIYADSGGWENARRFYEQAVHLAPEFGPAQYRLGICWVQLGNLETAITHLERAAILMSSEPDVLLTLGQVYAKTGQTANARAQFARVLDLRPGDVQARAELEQLP